MLKWVNFFVPQLQSFYIANQQQYCLTSISILNKIKAYSFLICLQSETFFYSNSCPFLKIFLVVNLKLKILIKFLFLLFSFRFIKFLNILNQSCFKSFVGSFSFVWEKSWSSKTFLKKFIPVFSIYSFASKFSCSLLIFSTFI